MSQRLQPIKVWTERCEANESLCSYMQSENAHTHALEAANFPFVLSIVRVAGGERGELLLWRGKRLDHSTPYTDPYTKAAVSFFETMTECVTWTWSLDRPTKRHRCEACSETGRVHLDRVRYLVCYHYAISHRCTLILQTSV